MWVPARIPGDVGFLIKTKQAYLPDFTAVLIALSAWLKPSAEPGTRKLSVSNGDLVLQSHHGFVRPENPYQSQWK